MAIVPRGSDPELPERMQMVIHRHFPKSTERVLTYQFALGNNDAVLHFHFTLPGFFSFYGVF